jgi:pyruvate dehydrogenase kinase 2/3/4
VVERVAQQYTSDIQLLMNTPAPETPQQAVGFTNVLRQIRERQRHAMLALGHGVSTLSGLEQNEETRRTQRLLGRFFSAHLGTHMLIGNHLTLCDHGRTLVDVVRPYEIAQQAIDDARRSCTEMYGKSAPEVQFIASEPDVVTTYIHEHLRRILYETVTFALRGTIEHHETSGGLAAMPAVKVVMVKGEEDISFKVSDTAGGTPARQVERLWWYSWEDVMRVHFKSNAVSAGIQPVDRHNVTRSLCPFAMSTGGEQASLASMPGFGFGRGLPVARLAARYFGGDLDLISMEGYGTDVYVHLARADNQLENFPPSPEVADAIDRNYWVMPPPARELEA